MTPPPPQARGFTLIEIMCSMAVGALILLLAVCLLGNSGERYERIGGGAACEREARAAITQLTSDLSSAYFHKDGIFDKSTAAWRADRMGFLSLQPAHAQSDAGRIGDLCAVTYYLKDLTLNGGAIRCLMRGFRESQEVFSALSSDRVASLFVARPTQDEPIAFGVVSLQTTPKSRDTSGAWADWVPNATTRPEAVDVRLVVARRQLAAKLKTPDEWNGVGASARLLGQPSELDHNKNLETYSTLIRFGNVRKP